MGAAAGHGAKHQGQRHLLAQGLQGLAQHIGQARGFAHQRLQLGKYGVILIGLKVDLVADPFAAQQAYVAQGVQLFFQGAGGGLRLAGQFAQVHFLVRLHEQQCQHLAPVLVGKQQLG